MKNHVTFRLELYGSDATLFLRDIYPRVADGSLSPFEALFSSLSLVEESPRVSIFPCFNYFDYGFKE